MKYRLTPEAFTDLQNIHTYIAEEQYQSITAANVVTSIQATLERIADNPLMGRKTEYPNTYQFAMAKLPFATIYRIPGDIFISSRYSINRVIQTVNAIPNQGKIDL